MAIDNEKLKSGKDTINITKIGEHWAKVSEPTGLMIPPKPPQNIKILRQENAYISLL